MRMKEPLPNSKKALLAALNEIITSNDAREKKNEELTGSSFIAHLPLLTSLGSNVAGIGSTGSRLSAVRHPVARSHRSLRVLGKSFHLASVGMAALDFLYIPLLYTYAKIKGEPVPFTVSNNAQWLFATVLLSLAAVALALPPVALPLGLAMASLGAAASLGAVGKLYWDRRRLKTAQKTNNKNLEEAETTCHNLAEDAKTLKALLLRQDEQTDSATIKEIEEQVRVLTQQYKEAQQCVVTAQDKKIKLELAEKKTRFAQAFDKGVGLTLSMLSLAGLVLTLFVPPVGFAVLLAAASSGAFYVLTRLVVPLAQKGYTWFKKKDEGKSPLPKPTDGHGDDADSGVYDATAGEGPEAGPKRFTPSPADTTPDPTPHLADGDDQSRLRSSSRLSR